MLELILIILKIMLDRQKEVHINGGQIELMTQCIVILILKMKPH